MSRPDDSMTAAPAAAVSPPSDGPAGDASSEAEDRASVQTLEALTRRHGPATLEEVNDYLEGIPLEDLVAEGRRVATPRITRDSARLCGIVSQFLSHATDEQRQLVLGVTEALLRIVIWSAWQGQETYQQRQQALSDTEAAQGERTALAGDARRRAETRREVLHSALNVLIGERSPLQSRLASAYGKAATTSELGQSLRALVKLGQEVLDKPTPATQRRLEGSRLTPAFLAESLALAAEVEQRGQVAEAVSARPAIAQADVDVWDGRNMLFLEKIIDVFEAGHAADPRIPRLVPISLRTWLGRRRRERKPEETPPQG